MSALLYQGVITLTKRGFGRIPAQYELVKGDGKESEEAGP
jgi:hypothetical protein